MPNANSDVNLGANFKSAQNGVLLTARTKRQANTKVCIRATGDLRINDVMPNVDIILDALLRLKREEIELGEALLLGVVADLNVRGVQAAINHGLQAGNLVAEVEAANIKRRLGNLERQRGVLTSKVAA